MSDRREVLKTGSLSVIALNLGPPAASPYSRELPIFSAHLGEPITSGIVLEMYGIPSRPKTIISTALYTAS